MNFWQIKACFNLKYTSRKISAKAEKEALQNNINVNTNVSGVRKVGEPIFRRLGFDDDTSIEGTSDSDEGGMSRMAMGSGEAKFEEEARINAVNAEWEADVKEAQEKCDEILERNKEAIDMLRPFQL